MGAIRTKNLTKKFGQNAAIKNVCIDIIPGSITGFLGPNGAGKSTTMNILMGFIKATSGYAYIFGKEVSVSNPATRKHIGFLSNSTALDGSLTVRQELEYFGRLGGNYDPDYTSELVKKLNLDLTKKISSLSTGNYQKVALVIALMGKPKLLILDEPTNGLDPLTQAEFNRIIFDLKDSGSTIFISSHILSEVEELCDNFIFIRGGEIVAAKTRAELAESSQKFITIETKHSSKLSDELHRTFGHAAQFKPSSDGVLSFTLSGDFKPLFKILAKYKITNITIEASSLEDSFMKYYEDDHA